MRLLGLKDTHPTGFNEKTKVCLWLQTQLACTSIHTLGFGFVQKLYGLV